MKKYRLKKDLPTVRAGEVFVRKTDETMQVDTLHRVDSEDVFLPPSIDVVDIINFDEWFEEVKEFQPFKYMTSGMVIVMRGCSGGIEEFYRSIGNCYPLDTPDEVIVKEQKLIPQAMHCMKMAAKKAWFEFNGSEGPDWSNRLQEKWKLSYDHSTDIFLSTVNRIEQFGNLPCFPAEESCQTYIDNNQDDLKLLFGVE